MSAREGTRDNLAEAAALCEQEGYHEAAALLAAPPSEPTEWRVRDENDGDLFWVQSQKDADYYASLPNFTVTPLYAGAAPSSEREPEEECPDDCRMCSGEYCATHGVHPCECDGADRHYREPTPVAPPAPEGEEALEADAIAEEVWTMLRASGTNAHPDAVGELAHRLAARLRERVRQVEGERDDLAVLERDARVRWITADERRMDAERRAEAAEAALREIAALYPIPDRPFTGELPRAGFIARQYFAPKGGSPDE